jgi:hypothetical protein
MKTALVTIKFASNQEAIDMFYLIEFRDILERLYYNTKFSY